MSALFSAVNENTTRTWNGMRTLETSESALVDLFFKWGGSRGKFNDLVPTLAAALATDKDLAIRTILWGRDARSGAGERQLFKDAINFMAENQLLTVDEAARLLVKIPELGRFDDLFIFVGTVLEDAAFDLLRHAIFVDNNGLAAKWTPRKGPIAAKFRKFLDMSPRDYRKALVARTNVVEQAMCAKNWNSIDFSKVPSVAAARYQKAFLKNAPEAYASYKAALVRGDKDVKINASAVYPYDIIKSLRTGDTVVASQQWKALPDFLGGSEYKGILPVVDVSGSMSGVHVNGNYGAGAITALDVAISLGLYISERNRGIFKDEFITFSSRPKFQKLSGDLRSRYAQLQRADWEMSTNLHAVFELILGAAVKAEVDEADMPQTILILSDMQFNACVRHDDTAFGMIKRKYEAAGYKMPHVVFWNLNTGSGVPVKHDQNGTALVSGFSPSIMKSVLRADEMTPVAVMKATVMDARYNW